MKKNALCCADVFATPPRQLDKGVIENFMVKHLKIKSDRCLMVVTRKGIIVKFNIKDVISLDKGDYIVSIKTAVND